MMKELPRWSRVTFEEMCNNVSTRINDPKNSDYNIYVGLEHLDTLEPRINRFGSTQDVKSSMNLFKRGQILLGRRNWYLRRVAVADCDGICSADIYVLKPKHSKTIRGFLPIFMHSDQFFEEVMKYSTGSMSTRVKWSHLSRLTFDIPPPPQQTKIVGLISCIDNSVANTRSLLEKLKTYKTSKTDQLLSGKGLGHKKFKKVKWLFGKEIEIPEAWGIKKLVDVGKIVGGGTPDSKNKEYWNGDILWAVPTDITKLDTAYISNTQRKITRDGLDNSSAKLLPVGTVLLTSRATIGECAITTVPMSTNQGFQSIICKNTFNNAFIFYLMKFNQNTAIRLSYGTTFLEISKKEIEKMLIAVPNSITEQQKIASVLSGIDVIIKDVNDHLLKLKAMRKGIINEKLTPPKMENEIV